MSEKVKKNWKMDIAKWKSKKKEKEMDIAKCKSKKELRDGYSKKKSKKIKR